MRARPVTLIPHSQIFPRVYTGQTKLIIPFSSQPSEWNRLSQSLGIQIAPLPK